MLGPGKDPDLDQELDNHKLQFYLSYVYVGLKKAIVYGRMSPHMK